jgi:hyperosmotically inducible periplasmic protein
MRLISTQFLLGLSGIVLLAGIANAQGRYMLGDVRQAVDRIERDGDEYKDAMKKALEDVHLSAREQRVRELAEDMEDEVDNLKKNYRDGHYDKARENLDNSMLMAASVDRFMQRNYFGPEVRRAWENLRNDLNAIALGYNIEPLPNLALAERGTVAVTTAPASADRMAVGAISNRARARLEREVRNELVMLPYYGVFDNLTYRVEGDSVTLAGQVTRPTLKTDAERAVRDIEGVDRVINNIEALPLSPNDDRLRMATYRAIYGQSALSRYGIQAVPPIHIIVNNGHVTLDGVVANEGDRNIAGIQAQGVPGVFSVTNNLRVD